MGIEHLYFNKGKNYREVYSSAIRKMPYQHWSLLPETVRSYYVKKICLYGHGSAGKSALTEKLSEYFKTNYVHNIVTDTLGERDFDFEDISKIARAHASEILKKQKNANRILFCDTDFITAKIISKHYFDRVPEFPDWVEKTNNYDLYLFYDTELFSGSDVIWKIPDLAHEHEKWFFSELENAGMHYYFINGTGEERFLKSCNAVKLLISD
jgi:HTH-type transcriptional repressor of NAD biosynthesis genes